MTSDQIEVLKFLSNTTTLTIEYLRNKNNMTPEEKTTVWDMIKANVLYFLGISTG